MRESAKTFLAVAFREYPCISVPCECVGPCVGGRREGGGL